MAGAGLRTARCLGRQPRDSRQRHAARLQAGVRRLPHGLPARHAARQLVEPHDAGAGPALRHRRLAGCGHGAPDQHLAREAHAGTYKRVREAPPQDRITQSAWFERKHRDVEPGVWKRAAVGSRANCMACHTRADQGDFDEDRVRIPK